MSNPDLNGNENEKPEIHERQILVDGLCSGSLGCDNGAINGMRTAHEVLGALGLVGEIRY